MTLLKIFFDQDQTALKYKSWTTLGESMGILTGSGFHYRFLLAFSGWYLLASLAYIFSSQTTMKQHLEYAFWALGIGLILSLLMCWILLSGAFLPIQDLTAFQR